MNNECIFCKLSKKEIPCKIIYENDNFFSIPDANPNVAGHSLVISKKHFETVLNLPEDLGKDFLDCIKTTSLKLMKDFDAKGFNVLNNNFKEAGQIVNHLHFHILPRKKDDGVRILKKDS